MPFSMIPALDVMGNISNRSAVKQPQSLGRCDKWVSSDHSLWDGVISGSHLLICSCFLQMGCGVTAQWLQGSFCGPTTWL